MHLRKIFRRRKTLYLIFFITIFFASLPILKADGIIWSYDAQYHVLRIEALAEQIKYGAPFLKVNSLFFNGAGYASSLCYPDFFLYFPAILRAIGLSVQYSFHIFLITIIVAGWYTTFFVANLIIKNPYIAAMIAALYTLSPYHLDNLYSRIAVGEALAYVFFPLIAYGLYDFVFCNFSKPHIMGIGFAGLMLSHTISLLIAVLFCVVVILAPTAVDSEHYTARFAPKKLIKLIKTALVTLLITSFFWIPLLELKLTMTLAIDQPWARVGEYAVAFNVFWRDNIVPYYKECAIGSLLILLQLPRLFIKRSPPIQIANWFSCIGICCMLAATEIIPWHLLEETPLNMIQFPWRLFTLASLFLSISGGIYLYFILYGRRRLYGVLLLALIIEFTFIHYASMTFGYNEELDYFSKPENTSFDGEWLPQSSRGHIEEILTLTPQDDQKKVYQFTREGKYTIIPIYDSIQYIDVPTLFYTGMYAEFHADDGNRTKLPISGEGPYGTCRVLLNNSTEGSVYVYYKGTAALLISYIISAITFIGCICYLMHSKYKFYR